MGFTTGGSGICGDTFEWHDIRCQVKYNGSSSVGGSGGSGKEGTMKKGQPLEILRGVSGSLAAGEMLAIVGE